MINKTCECELASLPSRGKRAQHFPTRASEHVPSPAAFDEIFARLARKSDRNDHSTDFATPFGKRRPASRADAKQACLMAGFGKVPASDSPSELRPIDAGAMREVADELDRQHERLVRLLRDLAAE